MILAKIYKTGIVTLMMIIITSTGHAQKMAIRLGDSNFRDYNFVEAIDYYEFAYERDTSNVYVIRRLAESNQNIGKTKEVEKWLKILIGQEGAEVRDFYRYAQALKSNGKYAEAEKYMREYANLSPNDSRTIMEVSMLEYIQYLIRDSSKYIIRNVSTNTPGSDMGPAYYKDQLVFSSTSLGNNTRKRTYGWNELPYLDLYIATITANGDLVSPKPFAPKLKTEFHDGPLTYDEKNDRIFYTMNNLMKGRTKKSKEGIINLKINFAKNGENGWEYNGSFRFNSDEYSAGHPSIDTTGNVLYFASDMPGGYGGSDIYSTTFKDGYWSTPLNLGLKINTEANELFPFISNEGVLYFASNGHGGMGGLDIFFSVPENGIFKNIENMGYPINSPKDDFAMVIDKTGMQGYFTSNRISGKGNDDIYYMKIKFVPVILRGIVHDKTTGEPLGNTTISIINNAGDTIHSTLSRMNGAFEFELNKGQFYSVFAEKPLYSNETKTVSTAGLRPNQEIFIEISLESLSPPEVIAADEYAEPLRMEEEDGEPIQILELEYINYNLDKWNIRPDAADILDRLIGIMMDNPEMEIRLESHTDSRGSDEYNMQLSKRRARAAFEYLVDRGIDSARVQYEGYGETRLLNRCTNGVECSEEEHEVNRRTIVKVIRKGEARSRRGQRGIFIF